MRDKCLDFLREARAVISEEQSSGTHSSPQDVTLTAIDTAILWRCHDLHFREPVVNESLEPWSVRNNQVNKHYTHGPMRPRYKVNSEVVGKNSNRRRKK